MLKLWKHLPSFKGKKSLIKALHKKQIENAQEVVFRCNYDLLFLVPNLIENISFDLFFEGIYEKKLVDFILKDLPQNGIFVDVGANIGSISLFVARKRPDVTVYALEASPHIYAYLRKNIDQNNLLNIHAWNLAIHRENDLNLDFFAPHDKFGKGSFAQVFECIPEKVKTIRMDRFFDQHNVKPDLIKVDVEGFEAMIFESMGDYLISEPRPKIVFEFVDWAENCSNIYSPGDAQRILLKNRYQLQLLNEYSAGIRNTIIHPYTKGTHEIVALPN
jgi:FkbM family methyltransferase